jgi:outer membrane lipoprotein-sorting protein
MSLASTAEAPQVWWLELPQGRSQAFGTDVGQRGRPGSWLKAVAALLVLCVVMLACPQPARADSLQLDTLMQLLAQTKASRATFSEKKYLSAVETPLESSGELLYQAPDRLEKRTLKPSLESLVLDKDVLQFERAGRKRSIALQAYPEVGAFVDSIRATLAGDQQALARSYRMTLQGKSERWFLQLQPVQAKAAALVAQIKVSGQRERIDTIEILQANGDRSVMSVTPVSPSVAASH